MLLRVEDEGGCAQCPEGVGQRGRDPVDSGQALLEGRLSLNLALFYWYWEDYLLLH